MRQNIMEIARDSMPRNSGTGLFVERSTGPEIVPEWFTFDEVTPPQCRINWPEKSKESKHFSEVKTIKKDDEKTVSDVAKKGGNGAQKKRIPIQIGNLVFPSFGRAAEHFCVTVPAVGQWIKKGKTTNGEIAKKVENYVE